MKKIYFTSLILCVFLTLIGCENLTDSDLKNVTVSEAKSLKDGTLVKLRGTLEHVYGEMYQFSDSTGTITIEIEPVIWIINHINPASVHFPVYVEIEGDIEVDKNLWGTEREINVMRIRLL